MTDSDAVLRDVQRELHALTDTLHHVLHRQRGIMATYQELADELFASRSALAQINATLGGLNAAVATLRKRINDLLKAGTITQAQADILFEAAKDLTVTALATDATAAGIDTNPDDDEDAPPPTP